MRYLNSATERSPLSDLMGERLQLQMETSAVLLPHIKSGKLVPLATGPRRHPE